jgi:sulfur relay (sulfurtransferase) DsrC/TusE family protein
MNRYGSLILGLVFLALGIFIGSFGTIYFKGKAEGKSEEVPKDVYKKVGEVYITKTDLEMASSIPQISASKEDIEKGIIKLALFYNEGKNLGLDKDSMVKRLMYWAEKNVVADAFYRKYILPKITVDTTEVIKFINEHKEEFSTEIAMLTVSFQDPKLADTLKKLLRDGSYAANLMLEEFARGGKIGVQPTGYQNLGLGRFALNEEEYNALRGAKKGDVIGPFQVGPNIFVVAKVVDIRKTDINKLDLQVKSIIYQFLLEKRRVEVEDSVFSALSAKYGR